MAQYDFIPSWAKVDALPGTQAAQSHKVQYSPLHAIADIIGAVANRNKARGEQKAMEALYYPVDVNTSVYERFRPARAEGRPAANGTGASNAACATADAAAG